MDEINSKFEALMIVLSAIHGLSIEETIYYNICTTDLSQFIIMEVHQF